MRVARGISLSRRALHDCYALSRCSGRARNAGAVLVLTGKATSMPLPQRRRCRSLSSAAALPPPTSEAQPWPELGDLRDMYNSVGSRTRVRQHANPLRSDLQVPITPPESWAEYFDDPTRPLVLDVGCGSGRFGLALLRAADEEAASSSPSSSSSSSSRSSPVVPGFDPPYNLLGIEIRGKLVERANAWAAQLAVDRRARFLDGNATVSLPAGLLDSYPGPLALACVQYPDPHFKERHRKRRVVQAPFAVALAEALAPRTRKEKGEGEEGGSSDGKGGGGNESSSSNESSGSEKLPAIGRVFLQSDVEEVASSMRAAFEGAASGAMLEPCRTAHGEPPPQPAGGGEEEAAATGGAAKKKEWASWAAAGWLPENPLRVPTEREVHTLSQGLPVYRCLLVKKT